MGIRWNRWPIVFFFCTLQLVMLGQGSSSMDESFRQKPLSEVLRILEKKYRVKFAYDEEAISSVQVTRRIQARELEEALTQIFSGTGLIYQIPAPGQVLVRKEDNGLALENTFLDIQGQVVDGWSGVPLPFAHVLYSAADGVAADENGRFRCQVPLDSEGARLNIQYIGYQARQVNINPSNPPQNLTVRLSPKIEKLPGITVKEKAPLISRQAGRDGTTLRILPLARMSFFVGGKDLFRGLQMLPGVNATDDLSADLSIRSSNGDENLVLLDGMTLYNVTHFFGIFSIVNPNIVDQVRVYKNAFPAEYGGRTSAIIDMRTQPMRQEGWQGVVDLNFLTSNAVLEAPLNNNMSLLLGIRTANQDLGESSLFGKVDPTDGEVFVNVAQGRTSARTVSTQVPDFYFYDANLKWTWQASAKTGFLMSYFRGRDRFGYNFNRKVYPPFRRLNTYLQEQYLEEAQWQNDGISFRWDQQWLPLFRSQLTLSQSGYQNETLITNQFSRVQDSVDSLKTQFENAHLNLVEETNIHAKNTWTWDKEQSLNFGYQGAYSHVRFSIDEDGRSPLNGNRRAPQHSFYAQYQTGKALGDFSADLGLRETFFNGKGYWSPRVFLSYKAGEALQLKGSFGLYQQFVRQLYHEDRFGRSFQYWVLSDERFPVALSKNFMLGITHKNSLFDLDVEFYQKNTEGVLEHALKRTGLPTVDGKPVPFRYILLKGTGQTKGVDVLLQKSSEKYAWWAAYTLSKSTHSFPQVFRGNPFPAPNDRRHQLKLNGQYILGKFDVGATYIFASGRPYTDLSLFENQEGDRTLLAPEDRLEYLEDYHRVDVYGNYSFPIWGGAEGKIGISLYNLFDRENVKYRQFIYSFLTPADPGNSNSKLPVNTVVGTELEMLGFTPNISFQVKF